MDDAGIELAVVEQRVGRNPDAAAVLRRISEDDEHDLLITSVDTDMAWAKVRQHAKDRVEIDRRSAQKLHALARVAGTFGIEAEACDAGVAEVVGERDVHLADFAVDRDVTRFGNSSRDAVHAREVVSRSQWNERKRSAAEIEFAQREVERAVSAAHDHAIEAGAGTLGRRPRQIRRARAGIGVDIRSAMA